MATNLIEGSEIGLKEEQKQTEFMGKKLFNKITHDPVGLAMIFPYYS